MALGLTPTSMIDGVLEGVTDSFRREFEAELRSRLLAVAEAEIEFIVKETADRVQVGVDAFFSQRDKCWHINQQVRITDARTSQKPVPA